MPRALIYVRVSSDEQVKGMSLDFQKEDCLSYARQRDFEVAEVFEERGESAKFADRPQLISLLEYSRKHRATIDALIVWKLDRLSRNQMDYYYIKRTLLDLGIAIHSATERSMEGSDSIAGKVYETFSALQAEIDNTIRSERTRRGIAAKIAAGIYPYKPPMGYLCQHAKKHGEKKLRPDEPDPVLFPIIQASLREYGQGLYNQKDLGRALDARGFAEIRGRPTRPQIVERLLTTNLPFYAGILHNPWTGEQVRGLHQPMLSHEEYLAVIAVRDGRRRDIAPKRDRFNDTFPLRGTLVCSDCGTRYTASIARGNGGHFAYYHCRLKGCPAYGKSVRKKRAETDFAKRIDRYHLDDSFFPKLRATIEARVAERSVSNQTTVDECDKIQASLEQKRARLYEMREDGSYTKEEFLERKTQVDRELAAVQMKRSHNEGGDYDLLELYDAAEPLLRELTTPWSKLLPDLKRRFQQIVFPEGIRYHRETGLGTAQMCCLFELNKRFRACNSLMVTCEGIGWNHIIAELKLLANKGKTLERESKPSAGEVEST